MANPLPTTFVVGPNFRQTTRVAAIQLDSYGLLYESATDLLTATAGGGQANAIDLVSEMNRISTVANPGDSVSLPPAQAGLTIFIENAGANPMQVFSANSETINGLNGATVGVSQMAGSVCIYTCYSFATGWFVANLGTGYSGSLQTSSTASGIIAHAGGGQGSATQLTAMINNVTLVASANDSVVLPASAIGLQIAIANNGSNALAVFCPVGSTLNGTTNGSASMGTTSITIFFCLTATAWITK